MVISTGDGSRYRNSEEDEFARQDRNGDGVISRAEWLGSPMEFYRLDYNRDGVLTSREYFSRNRDAFPSPQYRSSRDAFSALDLDGNGVLSPNEWNGSPNDFYRLDHNHDGVLSRSEFFVQSGGYSPYERGDTQMSEFDTNGDGVISRAEWPYDRISFDRLDRNRDGVLSLDELENSSTQDSTGQSLQTLLDGLFNKK